MPHVYNDSDPSTAEQDQARSAGYKFGQSGKTSWDAKREADRHMDPQAFLNGYDDGNGERKDDEPEAYCVECDDRLADCEIGKHRVCQNCVEADCDGRAAMDFERRAYGLGD